MSEIYMPKELTEPFNDYYDGVSAEYDRRSAQWGFECGVIHGESSASKPDYQHVIEKIEVLHGYITKDDVLAILKEAGE